MHDVIDLGIDAKHSNEDIIAPFDEWIARYGERIGLLGGIDVDLLCQQHRRLPSTRGLRKGSPLSPPPAATPSARAIRSPNTCRWKTTSP